MGSRHARLAVLGMAVAALLLGGCNDDDGDDPSTTTTSSSSATTTTPATGATTTPGPGATTTTVTIPAPPPPVVGFTASSGGGSGETVITWDPLPASADVASYKLYKRKADGTNLTPATVTDATLGIEPGRLGIVDAPDIGPWATSPLEADPGPRCYQVSAVSAGGVEGPQSAEACASPVGG